MSRKRELRLIITAMMIIFLLVANMVFSQSKRNCNYQPPHEANQWVFGDKAMLNFNTGEPIATESSRVFDAPNGVASIADKEGNLMLVTNGHTVWNRFGYVLNNGNDLKGNNMATQSAIIVPDPGNNSKYYVFTVDVFYPPYSNNGINYSVVEMTGASTGGVISKNNFLFGENDEKVCAIKHANGRDYWIVFHGFGDSKGGKFFSYLLSDTLTETPVVSTVGSIHHNNSINGEGYMKASSDGKKIALVIPADGKVEIFDFDASTGIVSDPVTSADNQFVFPFGLEFSPDNTKLYISTSPPEINMNSLFQLDLSQANPFQNPVEIISFVVNHNQGADSLLGALQLGIDGKIYLAKFRQSVYTKDYLGVIYNPNRAGTACNYNKLNHQNNNGLYLNGGGSLIGLPTFVSSYLNIPHFWVVNQCYHDTTSFQIRNTANIDEANWDFKDPAGNLVDNNPMYPEYVFSEPGDYNVELTEHYGTETYSFNKNIHINPLPAVDIGNGADTIYILPKSSLRLDAGNYDKYYWQPSGSSDRYIDVSAEGLYRVTVTDSNCCSNSDEVYIKYANLAFPNAFRPSSNVASNRTFTVIGNIGALASYSLFIFNRWGQQIFKSNNPHQGWDGRYNGKLAERGTYVWVSVFKSFESGVQNAIEVKNQGTVTLIR